MDILPGLTDAQVALIVAEKATFARIAGEKKEQDVIDKANFFLKWLKDNK